MHTTDRDLRLTAIRNRISDLIYSYIPEGKHGAREPSLLQALDQLSEQLAETTPPPTNGHTKPQSKPPLTLEHIDHARKIRTQAITWDLRLRGQGATPQTADLALRSIPHNATYANDHTLTQLHTDVKKWHHTALTLIGYTEPEEQPHHYPAPCRTCGHKQLYGHPHSYTLTCRACETVYTADDIARLTQALT